MKAFAWKQNSFKKPKVPLKPGQIQHKLSVGAAKLLIVTHLSTHTPLTHKSPKQSQLCYNFNGSLTHAVSALWAGVSLCVKAMLTADFTAGHYYSAWHQSTSLQQLPSCVVRFLGAWLTACCPWTSVKRFWGMLCAALPPKTSR